MPNLKIKAKENINSADVLIERGFYSASIHCLYYSCFQFSKYILNKYGNVSYEEQNDKRNVSSHENIKNQTFQMLSKNNRFKAVDYNKNFSLLKEARKKADYTAKIIGEAEANYAKRVANELNIELAKIYNEEL